MQVNHDWTMNGQTPASNKENTSRENQHIQHFGSPKDFLFGQSNIRWKFDFQEYYVRWTFWRDILTSETFNKWESGTSGT